MTQEENDQLVKNMTKGSSLGCIPMATFLAVCAGLYAYSLGMSGQAIAGWMATTAFGWVCVLPSVIIILFTLSVLGVILGITLVQVLLKPGYRHY